MASVQVAVRVRPLSKRETKEGGRIIVEVDGKVAKIKNLKVDSRADGFGDSREKVLAFDFDYCYWSVNPEDPQYASQDVVFQDLGTEVLSGAAKGYNICLFAYGQTGSGKTYTMLGTPASMGLTPRICEGLFIREEDYASLPSSCKIKVSFLEIYNERVRDLLTKSGQRKSYTLRVREHPEMGPYVQGLSQHLVTSYKQVIQLLEEGIANRITAATHIHEASSRSHAIFTIHYTQANLANNLPSEIASKINLVDLAGSERADPSYCKDRITEGANINKSLVTLGIVISTLAQNSQGLSSCQSISCVASSRGTSAGRAPRRRSYIPYRDSVLTWLLKDSLGGNSKTIMVATVSPAHTSYSETMSTLRYASSAKNIINKPQVNERNFCWLDSEKDENLKELVLQNELKIDQLTKDWTEKWNDWQAVMEHYSVGINRRRAGVMIDSSLPHLLALEDDVLSTGVVLYHLKEGTTKIGRIDSDQEQDIVLQGQWIERDHCTITSACGVVILRPVQGARCTVNGREVTASCRLTQGAVITLGKAQKFRFNHPAEAAVLRQRRQVGEPVGGSGSLEWLDLNGDVTASHLGLCPLFWKQRTVLEEQCGKNHQLLKDGDTSHRAHILQQPCYVESLRQQILAGQIRAEKDLGLDKACISQPVKDNQQWLRREETCLGGFQQQQQENCGVEKECEALVTPDAWIRTDLEPQPSQLVRSQKKVAPLLLPWRHAVRAAEGSSRCKKVSFQLARAIKKRRLLEAQRRLEQLRALSWLQDGGAKKPLRRIPSPDASVPALQCHNKSAGHSFLSLRNLCSQHLPQLHSAFLNWDLSTILPPMPDPTHQVLEKTPSEEHFPKAAAYPARTVRLHRSGLRFPGHKQFFATRGVLARKGPPIPGIHLTVSPKFVEREGVGKQPRKLVSQGLASLSQSIKKLKLKTEPKACTPTMARRTKVTNPSQAEWQKEEKLGTHRPVKGGSPNPHVPKQAAGHGKAVKAFQEESKLSSLSSASKRHQKFLVARVKDIARTSSHVPRGSLSKREYSKGDPDTMAPLTDSSPGMRHTREKDHDFSDTDSSYSEDSLSCVCAKAQTEPLKPEESKEKRWDLPGIENSESDDSQISEDSLAGKGYQSSKDSPRTKHMTSDCGHPRTRNRATKSHFTTVSSDSGLLAQTHKSFFLSSLMDAEEELEGYQQKGTLLGSTDEMPTETFWHQQNSSRPLVEQEAICRLGPVSHQTEATLDTKMPVRSSFDLNPQVQPHCEQPESEAEASNSERVNSLQGMQHSRESPLVSMDSWFSCDSKISPSSPPAMVGSSCPSPEMQEVQPCGGERPGYWLNIEELKSAGAETVFPRGFKLSQDSAELPCHVGNVCTTSTSDTSKLSLWEEEKHLQPGAEGILQDRGIADVTQQGNSEASQNSSVSSVLAASAASFTYVGNTCERDWVALQQKYLLELSHPVVEAIGESKVAFPCLGKDSSFLAEASGKGRGSVMAPSSGVFNNFQIHQSKIRHLRAEKEQDSLNAKLESTSDFFSTSEKGVNYNETYSADIESLASGSAKAQIFAAENKNIKQNQFKGCFQGSRKSGLITSSREYFFQKNSCYNNVTIAAKVDHSWTPLRKPGVVQSEQLSHDSRSSLQEEKAECQDSSQEVAGTQTDVSFAVSLGPKLFLHSNPWNPFPSSLQPPPLETFYVTKSRDALTETALEIPAYREMRVPSPPLREAWGFRHDHQDLQNAYSENNLSVLSGNQSAKTASSQQVTAEMSVDLKARQTIRELGKYLRSAKEESSNSDSVNSFVAEDKCFISSTNTEVCEFENQVSILNKKHNFSAHMEGKETAAQSCGNVSSDSSGSGKPLLLICESETGGEDEQDQISVLSQTQTHDTSRQFVKSDFIYQHPRSHPEKARPGEGTVSLKSRKLHHRESSPVMVQEENVACKWEGKNGTGLQVKTLHPKDNSEESKPAGTESVYDRCQQVTCSQERDLGAYKGPGQEILCPKEETSGKEENKRVSSAEEMARLIKSVMQLESRILEIGSKQNMQFHASQTLGIDEEVVFQDQEKTSHVLTTGTPEDYLVFKDQQSGQTDDRIVSDKEAEEAKINGNIAIDPQAQKITRSPFKSWEYIQEGKLLRAHTHSARLDLPTRDTCDSLGMCPAHRESTSTTFHQRRMKELVEALPLLPRPERSFESDKSGKASVSLSLRLGKELSGLEKELKTVEDFKEGHIANHVSSSKQEETKAQDHVEVMAVRNNGGLQEESEVVSLVQELPGPCQLCMSTSFSPETVCPLLSQTGFTAAPSPLGISDTSPLISPRPPKYHLHAPVTTGASLDLLDLTRLKIHDTQLVPGHQDQNGETGIHFHEENVRGGFSVEHTAYHASAISMAVSCGDILLGIEDKISSTSPQDLERNLRITSMGFNDREGFTSRTEASVQQESRTSTLDRISRQFEKRVHFTLDDGNDQGRQRAEKEAEDLEHTSGVFLTSASLPGVPNPEPSLLEPSIHASVCLAILEEIRQAKAQRKQLSDFVAEETALPYHENLPDFSSRAAGQSYYEQMDHLMLYRTRSEGGVQEFHMSCPSVATDKREGQTTPTAVDSLQILPNTESERGPCHPSHACSPPAPAADKARCTRDRKPPLRGGKQFMSRLSSSETVEKKTEARTLTFADPLASGSFLSARAVEGVRRYMSEKVTVALSPKAPCDDAEMIPCRQSHFAAWESAEEMHTGRPNSSPEYQEPRTVDSAYGELSGSAEGSRTLSSSRGEENKTLCREPCNFQPVAVHACPSSSSTSSCYRNGDPEKRTNAVLHTVHSPHVLHSRTCDMNEKGQSSCREPEVLLAYTLEPRGVNMERGPGDITAVEPSTTTAKGDRSPSVPEARADSFSHLAANESSRPPRSPEKKIAKKGITELGSDSTHEDKRSKPLRKSQHSSVGGQSTQASHTVPKPPPATWGSSHPMNVSGDSLDSELLVEPHHESLENTAMCLSEKTRLSTEARDHSCLNSQSKFVTRLKLVHSPQAESTWEEEEQQRDEALGGGEEPAHGENPTPSDEGPVRDGGIKETAVTESPVSNSSSSDLRPREALQPAAHHRSSLPVIAVFCGPRHSKTSPRPQFSVVSSSRSLQELNLSVRPLSSSDEDIQKANRLLISHLQGEGTFPVRLVPRASLKAEDCGQKSSSDLADDPAGHLLLKPTIPPHPASSTALCMPASDFMTSKMSVSLEPAQQRKPKRQDESGNWNSQVIKGMSDVASSGIQPRVLPQYSEEPVGIDWKQHMLGSVVDGSCSQKPQSLTLSDNTLLAQSSSMDNGSEDQNSLVYSHLCSCAKTLDLVGSHNTTENAFGSDEACQVCPSSFDMGEPHVMTGPEGLAPTLDPDKRAQFKGCPDEVGCLKHDLPVAGESTVGPVEEMLLLYTSEAGCHGGLARMSTFEQGTQTVNCRCPWSRTELTSAEPEASTVSASDLASWTSMHNLSVHLSQLLHSTSELLRSLSQPSVTKKQHNMEKDTLEKASQALMMDGSTQTTLDKGSQTDLSLPALCMQNQEAKVQEANVILEVLGSEAETVSQDKGDVSGTLQKGEREAAVGSPDPQEESAHCSAQSPPGPTPCLRVYKPPLGQDLHSVNSPASLDASLWPSSQPKESSCVVSSSCSPIISQFPLPFPSPSESGVEPRVQKQPSPTSALLVDRASSPIFTFSISTQELGLHRGSPTFSVPSPPPLKSHQKLDCSPDFPFSAPRAAMDNCSQTTDKSGGSQRMETLEEGTNPSERSRGKLFLELNSLDSPQQSPGLQVSCLEQAPQQFQPQSAIRIPSRCPPPPPRHESQRWADSFVLMASPEHGPPNNQGPSQQSRPENGAESPASLVEQQPTLDGCSSWGGFPHLGPCPDSELTDTVGLHSPTLGPLQVSQPEGLLCPSSKMCLSPEPQHHSLGDVPVHNKFSNWCGVQDGSPRGLSVTVELGASCDLGSGEQGQRPPPAEDQSRNPGWSQRELIPLQTGTQTLSLSLELAEAKLHHGFGEADALLHALQSETGEAVTLAGPVMSTWEKLHVRQKKTIETLRREQADRLESFRRARSLSPQKKLSLLPSRFLPSQDLELPSRRREYLQQLRKDVVETTRNSESALKAVHLPSDITLMLQEYQRAREEAKVEIARAQDRLREQTEQEKLRIRQQIVSQLLREEMKLHTLANSSSLCSSSSGSVSSGITSGYNSSPALAGQLQSPESVGDINLSDSRDIWLENGRGRSAQRSSHAYLARSAYRRRPSQSSCCCSPTSLSVPATCFSSSSYQDLAKRVVDTSMADVMAACSDNLHNLFSRQAAAGWNYHGEEQEVQLYYKVFSSTRHGFLGAGVVPQPVSHVWAAVSDPTLWPLFHKPIQTARLHQRVTNSISLVYLVCNTTTCVLKQPRDFCCVCVEAKEGTLYIMAAQSVYDRTMPRPSKNMVRGEILPSAWILQPAVVEGKGITRVVYLAQVELGAPGFPPQLLSSFIKQQPLVIARLASFLGS
ncbi:stAR-related lipid transfer protein 9 isoform X2 [Ochotona princeps]|uniref:stAR-related lipid transfer protein 9 isoform X2 n=1 Tax=Ochotona princeps TaxID=9978 RepID=UPI0027147D51|nr:stAR-related lipid transfer protein 9 isoform X2 [Ochotona princeps]